MAESNEDENNDVQMKEICVIPIDQPGQRKWSFWITATFFVVAAKENGIFALQKFAVGQMITQGITAGVQGLRAALKAVYRSLKGENPHLFLLFLKKGGVFDVEILTDILCNM